MKNTFFRLKSVPLLFTERYQCWHSFSLKIRLACRWAGDVNANTVAGADWVMDRVVFCGGEAMSRMPCE
jgi:hypothetical protein